MAVNADNITPVNPAQPTDSDVFNLVNNVGGMTVPSPGESMEAGLVSEPLWKNNTSPWGEHVPKPDDIPSEGIGFIEDVHKRHWYEHIGPGTGEQDDPIIGDEPGTDAGGDFGTGDFFVGLDYIPDWAELRSRARASWADIETEINALGNDIATEDGPWYIAHGSNALEEFFSNRLADNEFVLQYLGGYQGWELDTIMADGTGQDFPQMWRTLMEFKHVYQIGYGSGGVPYTDEQFAEQGGALGIYQSNPDLYGDDWTQWSLLPVNNDNMDYVLDDMARAMMSGNDAWGGGYQQDEEQLVNWEGVLQWIDVDGTSTSEEFDQFGNPNDPYMVPSGDWPTPMSINSLVTSFEARKESMAGYMGGYIPEYWHGLYSLPDANLVMDNEEMIDAWTGDDYFSMIAPFIAGLGITVDEWMEQYGSYLEPYDLTVSQGIRDDINVLKDEARTAVSGSLEEEKMNMVKTGFEQTYQSTQNINDIFSMFDNTLNALDSQGELDLNQYNQGWYSSLLEMFATLGETGAFEWDTWNPDEEEPYGQMSNCMACYVDPYSYGLDNWTQCLDHIACTG